MEIKYEEWRNMKVITGFKGELTCQTVNRIKRVTEDLYYQVCREFYIPNPITPSVRLFRSPLGDVSQLILAKCITNIEDNYLYLCFNAGLYVHDPAHLFNVTIPHEIAHALVDQIFPEKLGIVHHGQEWKEMMEYMGLPAKEFADYSLNEAVRIVNYGEL